MISASKPFTWGIVPMSPNEWHQLHELWICMAPAENEFTLRYCYGEQNAHPRWLQFSPLQELRFPFAPWIEASQRLATRTVVAGTTVPVHLPPGESATLYVGTSLWICLMREESELLDIPVARLSDTWFGPNTRQGQICFACQTHARLSMDAIPPNPYKAITPVKIRNRSDEHLTVDRINLPVPNLALYEGKDRYWTSRVTVTKRSGTAAGEVEVSRDAPAECRSPVELAPPRQPLAHGVWHKAADLLLGQD